MLSTAQLAHIIQNFTITGGGRLTVKNTDGVNGGTTYIRWSDRLVCGQVFRSTVSTFYEIYCPANGDTVRRYASNSNVATNLTVTADGIPLQDWDSLWYELPITSEHSTVLTNL